VAGAVGIYADDDCGESVADDALRVTEQRRRVSGFVDAFNRSPYSVLLFGSPSFLDCGQLRLGDEEPETEYHRFLQALAFLDQAPSSHKLHARLSFLCLTLELLAFVG